MLRSSVDSGHMPAWVNAKSLLASDMGGLGYYYYYYVLKAIGRSILNQLWT